MWPFDKDKKQSDHESFQLKKNAPKERNLDQSDTFECIADEENEKSDNVSDTISDGDDDEVILPPEPELDPPVYGITGGVSYWGFSQRGESHIKNGAPCQDRCVIDVVNSSPLIIAGIADGVGSCMLSHYGAATATRSAMDYLKKELIAYNGSLDDAYVGDLRL